MNFKEAFALFSMNCKPWNLECMRNDYYSANLKRLNVKLVDPYTVKNVRNIFKQKTFFMLTVIVPGTKTFSASRILPETDGIHCSRLHDPDRNLPSTRKISSWRQLSFHAWKHIGKCSDIFFLTCAKNQPLHIDIKSTLQNTYIFGFTELLSLYETNRL